MVCAKNPHCKNDAIQKTLLQNALLEFFLCSVCIKNKTNLKRMVDFFMKMKEFL